MSTTVRHAFGDMSSAGTGKLAAALFTSTPGSPNRCSAASNAAAICSASRMSQATASTGAPIASMASRPASRCSGFRLAITIDAPTRANSAAIALPSPVPAPVTKTATPSKVPGGNAGAPRSGGYGSPIKPLLFAGSTISAPRVVRRTAGVAGVAHFGEVVAAVDEGLVDHLVVHRAADLRQRKVPDHLARHLHGDGRCGRDLVGHLACRGVELLFGNDARDDAVGQCLFGRQHASGEHH